MRRPTESGAFSGRVLVEPFNTSAGADRDALWCQVVPLLERQGDAWIGVSVRACSQQHLAAFDPVRYAAIDLSCNDLAWDILTHLGRLVRSDSGANPLNELSVRRVYLVDYSQSATDTATYASAFGSRTAAFDGYFPAARGLSMTPLIPGTDVILAMECAAIPACPFPLIEVQPQTDVEGFRARLTASQEYLNPGGAWVRRHDADELCDRYRLYEIAGAPHVGRMPDCAGSSDFPLSAHLRAALRRLFEWTERGDTPPTASRIRLERHDKVSVAATDGVGNALGGVRSPFIDVPLATYHVHSGPGISCKLAGREQPLAAETLERRYRCRVP